MVSSSVMDRLRKASQKLSPTSSKDTSAKKSSEPAGIFSIKVGKLDSIEHNALANSLSDGGVTVESKDLTEVGEEEKSSFIIDPNEVKEAGWNQKDV